MTTIEHRLMPDAALVAAIRPSLVHPDWKFIRPANDGEAYVHRRRPMTLIWSVAAESDGNFWQHLSVAHKDRPPTWEEMVAAKEWVMGTDSYAYQVCPPRRLYVNIHPNVLHLFRRVGDGRPFHPADDGRVLPEFSAGGSL